MNMIKPKIYLDTSVVSHYLADDAIEKQYDTRILWDQLMKGEYEIIVSPVNYEEFEKCKTPEEIDALYEVLNMLEFTFVDETVETHSLANEYLNTGIMPARTLDDCRHIAVASIYRCKYILSWNMKHFVKLKTMEMVKRVNEKLGVYQPMILTPAIFIEGGEENE